MGNYQQRQAKPLRHKAFRQHNPHEEL